MIDIHCHILYGVDDGAKDLEMSVEMLWEEAKQGVTDVILTPHYRRGMFAYDPELVAKNYDELYDEVSKRGIPIGLYLGCEYHVDSDMLYNLRSNRCYTLAGTEYCLTEYEYGASFDHMLRTTKWLVAAGYIPIIAHAERCDCIGKRPELLSELRAGGSLIQINADAVIGKDGGLFASRLCDRIIKEGNADLVASDAHNTTKRMIHMKECWDRISSKHGEETAERLMDINPGEIIRFAPEWV
ncbi:MAG: capsular biosynthesis protein [Lachnospiraceae bacterium]|nr:capsular biosynthesis protein [Lachnospiraceae bacterium]